MEKENKKVLTTEAFMILSALIDKLDIAEQLKTMEVNTGNDAQDKKELGKQVIVLIITKLYKAKEEVYELIALYNNCTIEEAKTCDIVATMKEILKIDGLADFLPQA